MDKYKDFKKEFDVDDESFKKKPKAVRKLCKKLLNDKGLREQLESSLRMARCLAKKRMDKKLRKALYWPEFWWEYVLYVDWFSRWIPRQSTDSAWTEPGTHEQQEVYDRLCHFYFLIDQSDACTENLQEDKWFSEWLVRFSNDWGEFLNTTASFSEDVLQSFLKDSPEYRVQDSMID